MENCQRFFTKIFELLEREKNAFLREDLDEVDTCIAEREVVFALALACKDELPENMLHNYLLKMQTLQTELAQVADEVLVKVRGSINNRRKQNQYANGYQQEKTRANKSFYCDTRS